MIQFNLTMYALGYFAVHNTWSNTGTVSLPPSIILIIIKKLIVKRGGITIKN